MNWYEKGLRQINHKDQVEDVRQKNYQKDIQAYNQEFYTNSAECFRFLERMGVRNKLQGILKDVWKIGQIKPFYTINEKPTPEYKFVSWAERFKPARYENNLPEWKTRLLEAFNENGVLGDARFQLSTGWPVFSQGGVDEGGETPDSIAIKNYKLTVGCFALPTCKILVVQSGNFTPGSYTEYMTDVRGQIVDNNVPFSETWLEEVLVADCADFIKSRAGWIQIDVTEALRHFKKDRKIIKPQNFEQLASSWRHVLKF